MKRHYHIIYDHQEIAEEIRNKNPLDFFKECINRYPNHNILEIAWVENGRNFKLSTLGEDEQT